MKKVQVRIHDQKAGILTQTAIGEFYFEYHEHYSGDPISLTMPVEQRAFIFAEFPPFFDGLLPEGIQLEGLLKAKKLDYDDYLGQLIATGKDLVGAVTVHEIEVEDE